MAKMPIHTDDLLEKLDRVLAQQWVPPAEHCGWCKISLTGREASLDFCTDRCQWQWHLTRTDGYCPDQGRGDQYEPPCPCPQHSATEAEMWAAMGLGRAYEAHVRFIEQENGQRLGRLELAHMQVMTERQVTVGFSPVSDGPPVSWRARLAAFLLGRAGIDPDS